MTHQQLEEDRNQFQLLVCGALHLNIHSPSFVHTHVYRTHVKQIDSNSKEQNNNLKKMREERREKKEKKVAVVIDNERNATLLSLSSSPPP